MAVRPPPASPLRVSRAHLTSPLPPQSFDDLPPELKAHIWSFLAYDPARKRHLCRATVPFVRRHKFQRIFIKSTPELQSFARLVEARDAFLVSQVDETSVGDHVRWLEVPHFAVSLTNEDKAKRALAPLRCIFRYCHELVSLVCLGSSAMRVLLSLQGASLPRLLKLEYLAFTELDAERDSPLARGHAVRLRRFPALRSLDIEVDWEDDDAFGTPDVSPPHVTGQLPITSLTLTAGESLSTPGAARFLADFGLLTELDLTVRGAIDIGSLLQACSTTLMHLSLQMPEDWDDDDTTPLNIDADLARFTHLTHLTLGARTYAPSCEVFPILAAHLPHLSSVILESDTPLVASKILRFVLLRGGPSRSLDKLVIDSVSGWTPILPSEHPDRPDVVDGTFSFARTWSLPRWTRAFTLADARELVDVAKRVGVEVKGGLVDALEIEDLRVREEAYLQERRDEVLLSLRGLFGEADA